VTDDAQRRQQEERVRKAAELVRLAKAAAEEAQRQREREAAAERKRIEDRARELRRGGR
jgi:hypothetical protein